MGKIVDFENDDDRNSYLKAAIDDIGSGYGGTGKSLAKKKKKMAWYDEEGEKSFVKKGKGNFFEQALGTVTDFGLDVAEGFFNTTEGVADTGQYLLADVFSLFGNKKAAKGLRENADFNSFKQIFGENSEKDVILSSNDYRKGINTSSVLGEYGDQIGQGIGTTGAAVGMAGLGAGALGTPAVFASQTSSAATFVPMFLSSYGNTRSATRRAGYDDFNSITASLESGTIDGATELIFGVIPGLNKNSKLGDSIISAIGSGTEKYLGSTAAGVVKNIVGWAGEGAEELLGKMFTAQANDIIHALNKNYTYGMENQTGNIWKDTLNVLKDPETWSEFLTASASAMLTSGGSKIVTESQKNKVIKSYAKDNNMTFKDAKTKLENYSNIFEDVMEKGKSWNQQQEVKEQATKNAQDLMKGMKLTNGQTLDVKSIESAVEERLQQEINDKQERIAKATQEINEAPFELSTEEQLSILQENGLTSLQAPTETEIQQRREELTKNYIDQIQNSDKYSSYQYEKNDKMDSKEVKLRDSAVEFSNNTQEARNLVDTLANIQKTGNTQYELVDTNKLKELGYNVSDDSTINGLVHKSKDGNTIYINVESQKAYETVLGHEITHMLENTSDYSGLRELLYSQKTEAELEKLRSELRETYSEKDVEYELTADLAGELFENENFIKKLSGNRTLLQKMIDFLDGFITKVTGNKEKQRLKAAQKKYIDMYKEMTSNTNENINTTVEGEGTQFSIAKQNKQMLEQEFKKLTGDSLLVAEAKLGNYAFQQIQGREVEAPYNKEAMDIYEAIQNSKKTSSHLYHSTPADRIQSIIQNGLQVGSKQNQEGVSSENKLYLSATEELADSFTPEGSVMLRISPNAKLENLDYDLLGGEGSYTITNNIDPKYLQVKENGKWVNLLKSSYANDNVQYSLNKDNYTEEQYNAINKQIPKYAGMTKEQLNREFGYASDSYNEMIKLSNDLQKEYKEYQKTPEFMNALQNYDFDSEAWLKGDEYADKIRYYNREADKYFAQREAINSILMDSNTDTRSSKQIVKDAEKHFGITNDFKETAYITTNGNQLDFSGFHEGGTKGSRSLDHRQINEIDTDMDTFIAQGNIRVLPESGGINLEIEPNAKQYAALRDYIEYAKQNNDEIYVDVVTQNGSYDSIRYNKNTQASKIINDIKSYFENGSFPQQSRYADFLQYSISKDNQGRNLTQEQQEYFRDSKVRDSEGNLLTVYHGTSSDFTVFDRDLAGRNGSWYGNGFYLTPNLENARGYAGSNGNVIESYVNITNPYIPTGDTVRSDGTIEFAPTFYDDFQNRFKDSLPTDWNNLTNRQKGNAVRNILQDNGYDGIINGDTYVAFESNQIKNVDNTSPTTNEDIRYSISKTGKLQENGKDVKLETSEIGNSSNLMAMHNLSESKMNGILDLGGFPVPSIAITNPSKVNHDQYGEATAIFTKDTINPEYAANEVYDRDVWSPTFPTVDYNLSTEELDKISKDLGVRSYDLEDYADNNKTPEYLSDRLTRVDEVVDKYVADNNIEYETTYKSPELRVEFNELSNKIQDFVKDNDLDVFKLVNDENLRNEYYELIKEYYENANFPEQAKQKLYEEKIEQLNNYIDMQKGAGDNFVVRGFSRYQDDFNSIKNGLKPEVDEYATQKNKREAAINNGLKEYLMNEVQPLFSEKGIYNGKEYLTPSGNRRSFWQLHDEYNLENIVNAMTKGDTKGTQNWIAGFGQIQAQMANQFNTIDEIRAAQDRIVPDTNNTRLTEIREKLENDIDTLSEKHDGWNGMEIASELIADFASQKNHDVSTFRKLLNNDYQTFAGVTDSEINQIIEDLEELRYLPSDYFEAKPQRAVGLDEIGELVIPNTWSEETKQRLQDNGISYAEYDPTIEGDRNRVINQFDELKWSMSRNNDIAPARKKGLTYSEDVIKRDVYTGQLLQPESQNETQTETELPTREVDLPFDDVEYEEIPTERLRQRIEEKLNRISDKAIRMSTKDLELTRKEKAQLRDKLSKYKGWSREQLTNAEVYNDIYNMVSDYADRSYIITDEELKAVQKEIRKTPINISPELKNQITDYGDFRKENFGKLRLTDKGNQGVDVVYQELNEMYPQYFKNLDASPADQLYELADFMNRDINTIDEYRLDDTELNNAATQIFNKLITNSLTDGDINELQEKLDKKKISRKDVRAMLRDEMGISIEDIDKGKDISAINIARTDPIRLNEKVFGRELGNKINDATIRKTQHNEADRMRWLNKEREEIKNLGIKPRSAESAAVQKYGEKQFVDKNGEIKQYGDKELAQEFSDKNTQEKIKKAAEVLREKYDNYLDQINSELDYMGYNTIPKRSDYMHHFEELQDVFSKWGTPFNPTSLKENDLPTDINGLTEFNRPGKAWFSAAQQRMGAKTTYDAITGIDQYLEGASNLIYHTQDIQRYRALSEMIRDTYGQTKGFENLDTLSDEEATQRVKDILDNKLSKYAAWLDEQANALAGKKGAMDRSVERLIGRKGYSVMNTLKSQVGSNMTGFNVRSAMTNFISSTIAGAKTNKVALVKGTVSTINNLMHKDGFTDKSDFLTRRYGSDTLSPKLWQKISNAGQIFMNGSDYLTSQIITRSKYFEGLQNGMTEEAAIKYADDFAARVMGDRSKGSTAEVFNSKSLGLISQFQLEVNNQLDYMIHDTKMDYQAESNKAKAAAGAVFTLGQIAGYSYFFNELFEQVTGSRAAFDPIEIIKTLFGVGDDDDKTQEERNEEAILMLLENLPFGNILTGGGRIPISSALPITELITGKDQYGNDKSRKKILEEALPYYISPTGFGQAQKTLKSMKMYTNDLPGSYTDSGNLRFTASTEPADVARNLLFGQWSSKEADDYIESGYKSINSKKVPLVKELGLTSSEYREIQSGLSQAGTLKNDEGYEMYKDDDGDIYYYDKNSRQVYTESGEESSKDITTLTKANKKEAQLNYINSLDLPYKSKNALANDLFSSDNTKDKYGYDKYTETITNKNGKEVTKTYYYNPDTDTVYNSKYEVVDKDINKLTKVKSKEINLREMNSFNDYDEYVYSTKNEDKYNWMKSNGISYNDYSKSKESKEAYDWAYNNPNSYTLSKTITNDVVSYKKYKEDIDNIKADKTKSGKTISGSRKKKVVSYINKLDLSYEQKLVLFKSIYKSDKKNNKKIVNYINNMDMTVEEKYTALEKLGYKVDRKKGIVR